MSRGLGRVQNGCLVAIWEYERKGELPTTLDIAVKVYRIEPGEDGWRIVSDAQHVAVKRALEGLQRQGRVVGFRTGRARDPAHDGRTELCHHWMSPKGARTYLDLLQSDAKLLAQMGLNAASTGNRIERFLRKVKAAGMRLVSR